MQLYGQMYFSGKGYRTHRLAYYFAHKKWPPKGKLVRHTCDNPPCCNPNHLLLGTRADNVRDMQERGRRIIVKITRAQFNKVVQLIAENKNRLRGTGLSLEDIALVTDVGYQTVRAIRDGRMSPFKLKEINNED